MSKQIYQLIPFFNYFILEYLFLYFYRERFLYYI